MEPGPVTELDTQQPESENAWLDLAVQRLQYLYIVLMLLNVVMMGKHLLKEHAAEVDAVYEVAEEFIEAQVKEHIPESYGTFEEALETYPEFLAVYKHVDERVQKGEITEFQKQVIQQVLNRELWRYFRTPYTGYMFISEFKNRYNDTFKASIPDTSVGMTDLRADRITADVYAHLPETLRSTLRFDEDKGYVDPKNLADAVSTWNVSPVESTIIASDIYDAIIQANQDRIDQAALIGSYTEDQKIYVGAMLACCSTESEQDGGKFAFQFLETPDLMKSHWETVPVNIKDMIATQKWPVSAEEPQNSVTDQLRDTIRSAFVPESNIQR